MTKKKTQKQRNLISTDNCTEKRDQNTPHKKIDKTQANINCRLWTKE